MKIRITRGVIAKPTGQEAKACGPGEEIDVDNAQGEQLIRLKKAVAVEAVASAPTVKSTRG
jgi:hypothetical protein